MSMFDGKIILVTGGTGSLGKKIVNRLLKETKVKKVIVFSRDELKQFHMEKSIDDSRVRFFLGDVRDLSRLERAFHGVDIVIHTAALKQVPALEYNPLEAVKTNIYGSQNVIEAAVNQKVKKVLLISTDKAAQPVNLYGSTKLTAEKLFIAGNSYGSGDTIFSVVRYGNVVGSRGSIVDLLINGAAPEKIGITHKDMTRFWITLDQAVYLVTFSLENMKGGEIFIPKIPSMRLTDLFDALAPDVIREDIGIRPGEKIHEDLVTASEARHTVELDNYYVILPEFNYFKKSLHDDYIKNGKKVEPDFYYSSYNNSQWLTKDQLASMVKNLSIE